MTSDKPVLEPKTVILDKTVRGLVAGAGMAGLCEIPLEFLIAEPGEPKQLAFREVVQTVVFPAATRFAASTSVGGSIGSLAGYLFGQRHVQALQLEKNSEKGGRE